MSAWSQVTLAAESGLLQYDGNNPFIVLNVTKKHYYVVYPVQFLYVCFMQTMGIVISHQFKQSIQVVKHFISPISMISNDF